MKYKFKALRFNKHYQFYIYASTAIKYIKLQGFIKQRKKSCGTIFGVANKIAMCSERLVSEFISSLHWSLNFSVEVNRKRCCIINDSRFNN